MNTEWFVVPVDGISKDVMTVLKKATHVDPNERYTTPGDFALALKEVSSK